MTDLKDLGNQLTAMAEKLIEDVASEDVKTRVDAFKALSTFYVATTKLGGIVPDEDGPEGPSLKDMRERVRAAEEGK